MASGLSYLHCPLCGEEFHLGRGGPLQARLLPACAHSICTRCLQRCWSLQAAERAHPTFLCPIDGAPVRVTQVDDIPLNRVLLGLLATMHGGGSASDPDSGSSSGSIGTVDAEQCGSARDYKVGQYARPRCVEEECDNEAAWHCQTDEADMCEHHKQATHDARSNITRNHRLVRLEEKVTPYTPALA